MESKHTTSMQKAKIRSMRFVRNMFSVRGYRMDLVKRKYDVAQDLWQLSTETADGRKVLAVFSDCAAIGDSAQVDEVNAGDGDDTPTISSGTKRWSLQGEDDNDEDAPMAQPSTAASSKNAAAGTDFMKNLTRFARSQSYSIVIVVADFITGFAAKYLLGIRDLHITHFDYNETGIEHMNDHIAQPIVFRAVTGAERNAFIAKNPRYMVELQRYSVNDALIKFMGFLVGDIVYIEDNDRQTGLVTEYGLIVEEL